MIRLNNATLAATMELDVELLKVHKPPPLGRTVVVLLVGGERRELRIGETLRLKLETDWHETRR